MLEELVGVGAIGIGSAVAYMYAIGRYNRKIENNTPILKKEAQAWEHFEKITQFYNLGDTIEMRLMYRGLSHIRRVEGNPVIFIKMGSRAGVIQHEVIHYVNGDLYYDKEPQTMKEHTKNLYKYFFWAELKCTQRLAKELIT